MKGIFFSSFLHLDLNDDGVEDDIQYLNLKYISIYKIYNIYILLLLLLLYIIIIIIYIYI